MNEVNDILVVEKSDEILKDTNEPSGCNDTYSSVSHLPKTRNLGGIRDWLVTLLVVQYS